MGEKASHFRTTGIFASLFFVVALVLLLVNQLSATILAADLSGSTKEVDQSTALAGSQLQYTIVISNSGDATASNVIVTDTLPTELDYVESSLNIAVPSGVISNSAGVANDVVSWTGEIDANRSVTITFGAMLTDTLAVDDVVENTFDVTGDGLAATDAVSTTIVTMTHTYFPVMFSPVPAPTLESISRPNSNNEWTVTWSAENNNNVAYELEEDKSSAFSSPDLYDNGTGLTRDFNHEAGIDNYYCYRVRAVIGSQFSVWSNIECVVGAYYDNMSSSSSGWGIRQQDTDEVDNETYYQSGNHILKIHGRWDYAVTSPLRPAPEPPYEISSRIRLEEPDNLNSYGIIFGGDANGQICPNSTYTSCFNHYYRLQIIWYGANNKLRIRLKRIDYHEKKGNSGRGVGLTDYKDVRVGSPPEKYLEWKVQVLADGQIKIFVNGNQVASAQDSTYIHNSPYFGVFAASDEYLGSEPWIDWYEVTPID